MHFFDYELPERLIAQEPATRRDESRLLVLHRAEQRIEHRIFRDLPQLLSPGDLLVLNDTRVLPARVLGERLATGGKWEGLYLHQMGGLWEMMAKTRGYPKPGEVLSVSGSDQRFIIRGRTPDKHWLVEPDPPGEPEAILARIGRVPLPPYIRKGLAAAADTERYQTVFAAQNGSVAAPTAGLHFTPELLQQLESAGIGATRVTLHVGLGTFAPIKADDPAKHAIHREWCEVTDTACAAIEQCRQRGGRVIAVGTTATRTLETAARSGELRLFRGETDLYIRPPFDFHVVQGLVTNFHLPRTTLLLLVSAFAGGELLRRAYEEAIRESYRFYSYGDAMLIL
jgi:S-adenosylmethionine:tRNA ribosyltransferase-isomerase